VETVVRGACGQGQFGRDERIRTGCLVGFAFGREVMWYGLVVKRLVT